MASLRVTRKRSVQEDIERVQHRIAERAYALFRDRNGSGSDPLADWLDAEQALVWRPAIEVRERDGSVTVLVALPGVEPRDVEVDVTPHDVVVKAETTHKHSEDKGRVHRCEFVAGQLFRSIALPKPIDVVRAKAELHNGMLRVTAPVSADAPSDRITADASPPQPGAVRSALPGGWPAPMRWR